MIVSLGQVCAKGVGPNKHSATLMVIAHFHPRALDTPQYVNDESSHNPSYTLQQSIHTHSDISSHKYKFLLGLHDSLKLNYNLFLGYICFFLIHLICLFCYRANVGGSSEPQHGSAGLLCLDLTPSCYSIGCMRARAL